MAPLTRSLPSLMALAATASAACLSSGNQDTINNLFQTGGAGTVVQLCPGALISITNTISFTAADQELSTQGYPTDSTRATIQIAAGTDDSVGTAVNGQWQSGVRLLNIQLDGNRANAGLSTTGGALIEMDGGASGQTVYQVVSKNTRSWSCMHFIESGETSNPCTNGNITYNTVGPCGAEGTNSAGQSQWADGISMACSNSLVAYNEITGSTDGGIVIFGAPGTQVLNNKITSSSTYLGYGAINMVDDDYNGDYSGVVVSGNTITGTGTGLFNLGIGIGDHIWSFNTPNPYQGPATITNNVFIGNIGFSIAVNGWTDGLTITGNDVSQVTSPSSNFADASNGCSAQVQESFNANQQLVYYAPSITGAKDLQSNMVSVAQNATDWLCLQHPLPTSITWTAGSVGVTAANGGTVALLHNFKVQIQTNGNFVGYNTENGVDTAMWASSIYSTACGSDGSSCRVVLGGDGNFVEYDANGPVWSTGTSGTGAKVTFYNAAPWMEVFNSAGAVIWTLTELDKNAGN